MDKVDKTPLLKSYNSSEHNDSNNGDNNDCRSDHHNAHRTSLSPQNDKYLSYLHIFWNLFWLVVAEFTYLIFMIITQYVVAIEINHGGSGEVNTSPTTSSEHHIEESSKISNVDMALYMTPSIVIIVASALMAINRRDNMVIRKVHLGIVCATFLVGLAGFIVSLYNYSVSYEDKCEELQLRNPAVVRTLFIIFILSPLFFRGGYARAAWNDIKLSTANTYLEEKSRFEEEPPLKGWKSSIDLLNRVIILCCMPRCCRNPESEHSGHTTQHIVQLFYEIILLIVACVEGKYIELAAVIAGVLGSIFGLAHIYMFDIILNLLAAGTGIFLFGNTFAHLGCAKGDEWKVWIYLLTFNMAAGTIRIKSIIHAFVESRLQIYAWILDQLDWVIPSDSSVNHSLNDDKKLPTNHLFISVRNVGRLLKYPKPHHDAVKKDRRTCYIAVLITVGISVLVTAPIMMGVWLPYYEHAPQLSQTSKWTHTKCNWNADSRSIFDPKNYDSYVEIFQVTTPDNFDSFAAVLIWNRFGQPDPDHVKLQQQLLSNTFVPCRLPPSGLISQSDILDWDRKAPEWDRVIIIGSDEDFTEYSRNFYLLVILPVFGIVLGITFIVVGIVTVACCGKSSNLSVGAGNRRKK